MAKSKEDLIKELQELDSENKYPVKEDHNVADIKLRIDFLKLQEENESLTKLNRELQEANKDLSEAGAALANELKALQIQVSGKSEKPVVAIGKKKYRVNHGVNLKGKNISADEISNDEAIAKVLIEKGSTALELVEEE